MEQPTNLGTVEKQLENYLETIVMIYEPAPRGFKRLYKGKAAFVPEELRSRSIKTVPYWNAKHHLVIDIH
jgi:hypothetical protein